MQQYTVRNLSEQDTADFLAFLPSLSDDIQEINILACRHFFDWPLGCKLPLYLNTLRIVGTCMQTVPILSDLIHLETVDFRDNHIGSIIQPWLPPQVAMVDLSFNKIYHLDWTIFPKRASTIDVSHNFLTQGPPRPGFIYHHNNMSVYTYCSSILKLDIQAPSHIYTDKQNVHNPAVQSGARDAINKLKTMVDPLYILPRSKLVQDVRNKLYTKSYLCSCCCSSQDGACIADWCKDETTLYAGTITYPQLLGLVWAVIEHGQHKISLRMRLKEELEDGIGMCFTGRATRLLNSLQGIIEGIHIGVSEREALQARIATIIQRSRGSKRSCVLRQELEDTLVTSCNLMEGEREAWLDAFDEIAST